MTRNYLSCKKVWRQRGCFKGKHMVTLFLSSCQKLPFALSEMDTGLRGPGQTKDDSYGFDMQLERSHTLSFTWVVQAYQAALNTGSKKHLWCKAALKH